MTLSATKTGRRRLIASLALAGSGLLGLHSADAAAVAKDGPELAVLKAEEGTWDAAITFPSRDPAKPDAHAKGVQINTLRSDGKWMLNQFSVEGTPYSGTGVWGYDPTTGGYHGIWADNNAFTIRHDTGTWDAATHTMTWVGDQVQADGTHFKIDLVETFSGTTRTFKASGVSPKTGQVIVFQTIIFSKRP